MGSPVFAAGGFRHVPRTMFALPNHQIHTKSRFLSTVLRKIVVFTKLVVCTNSGVQHDLLECTKAYLHKVAN